MTPLEFVSLDSILPQIHGAVVTDDSLFIFDQLPEILVSEYKGVRVSIASITNQEALATGGFAQLNVGQWSGKTVAIKYALAQGSGKDTSIVRH